LFCRRIVADTKHTVTERSFRPYMLPTGNEELPNSLYYAGSAFVRGKILHNATSSEVFLMPMKHCTFWFIYFDKYVSHGNTKVATYF